MEHLKAMAQKLEGRICSTGGICSLAKGWARCHGPRACFQTSVLGWDIYSNFDFHKGVHLGSCGLAKALLVVCVSKMRNFCDFALEIAKNCGEICPKVPNFGTVGLKVSIYAVAKDFIFTKLVLPLKLS